jgi:hypothetical protein
MKNKIVIVSMAFISFLTNCQKESVNPSIEGTYVVNDYKALERYEDLRMCMMCGPMEIFPSKVLLVKSLEKYNLEIKGEHFKANSNLKESYSNTFANVIINEDRTTSTISFKGTVIGSIDNGNMKISDLIFEVGDKPSPLVDTKYFLVSAKK